MEELVKQIALKLGKKPADVEPVLQKFRDNWITNLWAYSKLSPEKKAALNLPAVLEAELDACTPARNQDVCWVQYKSVSMSLSRGGRMRYEVRYTDTLQHLLQSMGASKCVAADGVEVAHETQVALAVVPGCHILIGDTSYAVTPGTHPSALMAWLDELHLTQYAGLFISQGLEDFFAAPFLSEAALDCIGLHDKQHRAILLEAVRKLRQCSPVQFVGQWLRYLGCDAATIASFAERKIDLQSIREMPLDKLLESESSSSCPVLEEMIEMYKNFSSVEETFHWLRRHGFEKYAFHFARYNIPFYALPCVNFFIIDEMGVTHDDQLLLQALQSLKQSQNFDVRAVAFWLRDLELEKYNVAFASAGLLTLDQLTQLTEAKAEKLVDSPADMHKLKTGIQEMQEFQFYYLATASLLQELGMERYSQLFALHGISIDVLPFLTENQLVEMGITNKVDRKKILSAIEKIKHEIPQHASVWGNAMDSVKDSSSSRRGVGGMRKQQQQQQQQGGGLKQSGQQKQQQQEHHQVVFEERSVEELLSFISGTDETPSSKNKKKKKNRKNNNNNNNNNNNYKVVQDQKSKQATKQQTPTKQQQQQQQHQQQHHVVVEEVVEDPMNQEELDPMLKAQVDGEVEEFRRRLEAAGQSTKAKLTPIFYLPSEQGK